MGFIEPAGDIKMSLMPNIFQPLGHSLKKEKDKMLKAKLNFEIVRYVIGSIFKLNFVQALNDAVQAIKLLV